MRRLVIGLLVALATAAAGCGDGDTAGTARGLSSDWSEVEREARGQTVRWWMFGGDARVNAYVADRVRPEVEKAGVSLEIVPLDDTADAVQRLLAQKQAGRTDGGAIDLVWINGENFAQGKEADLWLPDWSTGLPNAERLDLDDPSITQDFGVPVEGQESPWSRAAFVFARDGARTTTPPRSVAELVAWARENPGRFTYPAPPDFTGSAFVRLAVQEIGEDAAFAALKELKPLQWREGETFPKSEAELNRLFGDGQVDLAMSYDPGFVASGVRSGQFSKSTRPFAFARTLTNTSYVAIPRDAANIQGAAVVANALLDPELQRLKADPDVLGVPTVLDLTRPEIAELFAGVAGGPYVIPPDELGEPVAELPATRVPEIEERWKREVLR